MAWQRAVPVIVASAAGVVLVAGGVLTGLSPARSSVIALVLALTVALPAAGLGVVVALRLANPVGTHLTLLALAVAVTAAAEIGAQVLAGRPDIAGSLTWLVAVRAEGAWWVLVAVAIVLLHFPTGRLPSRRWRWVVAALLVSVVVIQVYGAVEARAFRAPLQDLPRPFGPPPSWFEAVSVLAFVAMLGLLVASAASLLHRHRGDPMERRQIRWLAVGGILVIAYPLLCLVEIALWGRPLWLSGAVGILGLIALPVAVGIALLRPDVYDVDKALAGTVTWGLVSAALLALYAVVTIAAGVLLGRESALAAAGVTAVAALALAPLRRRLQSIVDRWLYPLRRAAFTAIETLHHDISTGRALPEQLEEVLRAALRDPRLRVGYRVPGTDGYVTADGVPVSVAGSQPVGLGAQQVGVLAPGEEGPSPELLSEVAERITTLVEMVRLRLELTGALREVESSRSRLVLLGLEERRRLERDLHDGAQQRLVSLGMAIRLAQRHLGDGTVDLDELLDTCVAELSAAVTELRQLAHGIRPSSLDDGLPVAVARLVRAVPVTVALQVDDAVLPDDVATTAYFVISEALANSVKHAEASSIELDVRRHDGGVLVRVSDDGRGGASLSSESGLADRVAALGGSLRIVSPPGRGTLVEARLPCAS